MPARSAREKARRLTGMGFITPKAQTVAKSYATAGVPKDEEGAASSLNLKIYNRLKSGKATTQWNLLEAAMLHRKDRVNLKEQISESKGAGKF
jgi:hypothetical protein